MHSYQYSANHSLHHRRSKTNISVKGYDASSSMICTTVTLATFFIRIVHKIRHRSTYFCLVVCSTYRCEPIRIVSPPQYSSSPTHQVRTIGRSKDVPAKIGRSDPLDRNVYIYVYIYLGSSIVKIYVVLHMETGKIISVVIVCVVR